ncbi:MAG: TonB-dependent receptor [bacterium]|nr:TonB-dependent receptor [bacterium]
MTKKLLFETKMFVALISLLIFLIGFPLNGQQEEVGEQVEATEEESLSDLVDLLNAITETATKTALKIDDVPAIVEIVTYQQIKQRGYRHLADVLNDIADNHEDRSNWGIGEPTNQNVGFGFRFDTGQNILLLADGQRLNAFLPGNRFGGEEYLPGNIERIEIIRGPGSALYGANAFTAVVNLISKQSLKDNEKSSLEIGSIGDVNASGMAVNVSWKTNVGGNSFFSGAFRAGTEKGQEIYVPNTLFGDAMLRDGVSYAINSDLFFSYKNFRTYMKVTRQKRNTFTGFNGINPTDNDNLSLFMYAYSLGADYTHKLSDKLEIKASVGGHRDNWTEIAMIPLFQVNEAGDQLVLDENGLPILDVVTVRRNGQTIDTPFIIDGQGADTLSLEGELQLTWNFTKKNNIILGFSVGYDKVLKSTRPTELRLDPFGIVPFQEFTDDANTWLFDPDATRTTIGFYAQADYDLNRSFALTVGARLDMYSGTGVLDQKYTELNPRVGIVYKNPNTGNIKLMYGRATRIPNGFETLSSVAILGDPGNRPERIRTLQAIWLKNWSKNFRTELGWFSSAIINHLVTDANLSDALLAQGFIGQFINMGSGVTLKSSGINGKISFRVKNIDGLINFTRYLNTDDGAGNDIDYITRTMINANLNIPVKWLNINIGANYRGGISQPAGDTRTFIPGYVLLNLTLLLTPGTLPVEFSLGARNLLDANIRYPSSKLDFPEHFIGRGLGIWGGMKFKF